MFTAVAAAAAFPPFTLHYRHHPRTTAATPARPLEPSLPPYLPSVPPSSPLSREPPSFRLCPFLCLSVVHSAHRSRVEPPFRAPPDSASATPAQPDARRFPGPAWGGFAPYGGSPRRAPGAVPGFRLLLRACGRTLHPPIGTHNSPARTRILSPVHLHTIAHPLVLTPGHIPLLPRGEHATPSSFRKLSPSPVLSTISPARVHLYAVSLTSCSLLFATSVAEVSGPARSSSSSRAAVLPILSESARRTCSRILCTDRRWSLPRFAAGRRPRVPDTSVANIIPRCSAPEHSPYNDR